MGGTGSGNFGHSGRPDEVGGSGAGGEKSYYYKTVHEKCEIATDLKMTQEITTYQTDPNMGGPDAQKYLDEYNSMNRWKGTGYITLDHFLRDKAGQESYPFDHEKAQKSVDIIDSVIAKSEMKEDLTVYRGISIRAGHELDVNGEFKNPSFTATSAKLASAIGFSQFRQEGGGEQNVMMIKVPKGSNAYYYGTKDSEAEILLPRDLSFKVTGMTTYAKGIHEKVTSPYVGDSHENDFETPITVYTMEIQK